MTIFAHTVPAPTECVVCSESEPLSYSWEDPAWPSRGKDLVCTGCLGVHTARVNDSIECFPDPKDYDSPGYSYGEDGAAQW